MDGAAQPKYAERNTPVNGQTIDGDVETGDWKTQAVKGFGKLNVSTSVPF
jgi:hypothetical protein